MITSIVFSKNRPLQLDLCLNSIKRNLSDCTRTIVIHNNSKDFEDAYDTLKSEHPSIEFFQQGQSIFRDTFENMISANTDFVMYLTDDDIVFSRGEINYSVLNDPLISCISLRMGLNICERYDSGELMRDNLAIGTAIKIPNGVVWSKTAHHYGSYWSYSLSVDGHIFRRKDMLTMLDEICYLELRGDRNWNQTPNEIETALQRFWTITPNLMSSPDHSIVVNSPNNRVQESHKNVSGLSHNYGAEYLLGKYMSGSRINLDHLDFSDIKCPHTEIDLLKGLE